MRCNSRLIALSLASSLSLVLPSGLTGQEVELRPAGAFAFHDSVTVSVPPSVAFDRFVDVDEWWDHRFSEESIRFELDARPGGGFYEIFDEAGNGALHATVIFVRRGEILRMDGPLGLSGNALHMVFTLEFESMAGGTLVRLSAHGAGELQEGWPEAVRSVWHHFLWERYQPYADTSSGAFLLEGSDGGEPGEGVFQMDGMTRLWNDP